MAKRSKKRCEALPILHPDAAGIPLRSNPHGSAPAKPGAGNTLMVLAHLYRRRGGVAPSRGAEALLAWSHHKPPL